MLLNIPALLQEKALKCQSIQSNKTEYKIESFSIIRLHLVTQSLDFKSE